MTVAADDFTTLTANADFVLEVESKATEDGVSAPVEFDGSDAAVVDVDAASPRYGQVVGWCPMPNTGDELHHQVERHPGSSQVARAGDDRFLQQLTVHATRSECDPVGDAQLVCGRDDVARLRGEVPGSLHAGRRCSDDGAAGRRETRQCPGIGDGPYQATGAPGRVEVRDTMTASEACQLVRAQ